MAANTTHCPKGHSLPNGKCTPLYCGNELKDTPIGIPLSKKEKEQLRVSEALRDESTEFSEQEKINRALVRHEKRNALLKVPTNLPEAELEGHVTKKLVSLLPYAAARLEYELKFGDEKQQHEAMVEVLDRTGFGRKNDSGNGGAPVIVINANSLELPWAKKQPHKEVVEGVIVPPEKK